VIGQALMAAYHTVDERICHSLHCYFIRPGDPKIPIIFEVDRARDGKSFTTRRVIAVQHGRQIFNLAASFQDLEPGFEHQTRMPDVAPPEQFREFSEMEAEFVSGLPAEQRRPLKQRPVELRLTDQLSGGQAGVLPTRNRVWFRLREPIGVDPRLQQAALAYCSDLLLLGSSFRPHGVNWHTPGLQSASLDHAMWFHHPTDPSQWHLYDMDSPSASGARGFNLGALYRHDGVLVASAAQEGLVRHRPTEG
jgi:acyl-CoA thioesterase-2